jgi:peptide/nickel transport system substrate-binding protein/oligopeptide transport system substrate-binding protein
MARWSFNPRGIAGLVYGALAILVAGCSLNPFASTASDMAPPSQQVLRYQLVTPSGDVAGLDPAVSFDNLQETSQSAHATALLPITLIYSGLVAFDDHLNVENWDASKITISPDGLKYTFTLRDGLKFSDGKPVTAADYAYSINRALDPCLASPVAAYLYEIKDALTFNAEKCTPGTNGAPNKYDQGYGQTAPAFSSLLKESVVAVDQHTLVITLAAPAAYFLAALAYPTAYAVEQGVVGANWLNSKWTDTLSQGATGQGGSGPYYVSAWKHDGTLVLKANPYFWKKPTIQTINISIYKDATTAYAAYTSGKDDIGYPPAAQLAQARQQKDFHQVGVLWVNYLGLNWKMAPFDDVRARQAFALALDKDSLNTTVLHGAQMPTNHVVPQGSPGYISALKGPDGVAGTTGDAAKAKTLWTQYVGAKCGGQASQCAPVTLTYSSSSATAAALATAMKTMWKTALGVNVTLQPEDFDTLLGQLATQSVQFWNIGWRAYYPDPQDWLSLQFLPQAEYNVGAVSLSAANDLLNKADVNPNAGQRMQQYGQAEQQLVDQVAWIPYDQVVDHWQNRSWIKGYAQSALGMPSLDQWLAMYIANH